MKVTSLLLPIIFLFLSHTGISQVNNALHFDGVDDYVDFSSPSIGFGDFTIEMWFESDNTDNGSFNRLIAFKGGNPRFELGEDNGEIAYWVVLSNPQSFSHSTVSGTNVRDGNCHHLVGVKDELDLILYLDGQQILNIQNHFDSNFLVFNGQIMRLGVWATTLGDFWNGSIDEVRIWDDVRTQTEIQDNMNHQLSGTEPNLVLYYDFNQGIASGNNSSQTTLLNKSDNSNNGTLSNFSLSENTSNWVTSCFLPCTDIDAGDVIDFEDLELSEGAEIFDQYDCGDCGVKFYLGHPDSNNHPVLTEVGGNSFFAFQGPLRSEPLCNVNSPVQFDMPAANQDVGCFFLTDDGEVSGVPLPLNIVYSNPTNRASGELLDIDGSEEWTISVYNGTTLIDQLTLCPQGNNCNASCFNYADCSVMSLDGVASYWEFNTVQSFDRIEFLYSGNMSVNVGLAFDNFSSCSTRAETELCGKAVVTCFSGLGVSTNNTTPNPNGPVIGIIDVRDRTSAPIGANWTVASVGHYHHNSWIASNLGEVFGIALDDSGNIFTTSSSVYGAHPYGSVGGGSGGAVYKINALTGNISNLVTLPNGNDPSKGPGLGNICYNEVVDKLYVTNFYDGLIYVLNPTTGNVEGTFDPFLTSNPNLIADYSFAPLGDRPWAIGINENEPNKLYFSNWIESNAASNGMVNQIFSVSLNNLGIPVGTEVLEVNIDEYVTGDRSSPTSDIAFSHNNKMLLGQRTMHGDIPPNNAIWAHASSIIEYERSSISPLSWTISAGNVWPFLYGFNNKFQIGNYGSRRNNAGGVDYGYESFSNTIPQNCSAMVWATGDALSPIVGSGAEPWIYGLQGLPSGGGNVSTSFLIDFNNVVTYPDKSLVGDVEIFKCTSCTVDTTDCTELEITYNKIPDGDQMRCCYSASITNNVGQEITKICIDLVNTPGWIINTASLIAGCSWVDVGSDQICIENSNGFPIGTTTDKFTFCLSEVNEAVMPADTQCIITSWYKDKIITQCQDTTKLICNDIEGDTCMVISNVEVMCNPENDYSYCVCFDITNNSGDVAASLILDNIVPNGFDFVNGCGSSGFPYGSGDWIFDFLDADGITPNFADGTTENVCVNILSSTVVNPGTIINFHGTLTNGTICCSEPALIEVEVNPCCDPCSSITSTIVENETSTDTSCCYTFGIEYTCNYSYFSKVQLDIITGGIAFGYAANALPLDWTMVGDDQTIMMTPTLTGTIPTANIPQLLDFCLTDVNEPSEIPQTIRVQYFTLINDEDVVVCDTLITLDCPLSKNSCAFIFNEQIECIPDSGKYRITVEVKNLSNPDFQATELIIMPGSSAQFTDPDVLSLTPPLPNDGSSRTVSFCYTPVPFPDSDGIFGINWYLHNAAKDSCCFGHEYIRDTLYLPDCDMDCQCEEHSEVVLYTENNTYTLNCEFDQPIPLKECPQKDKILKITGTINCKGGCEPSTLGSWELENISNNDPIIVIQNISLVNGQYELDLSNINFLKPGIYQARPQGYCGIEECNCFAEFTVRDGCDCSCPFDNINEPYVFQHIPQYKSCARTFRMYNVGPCDEVSWKVYNQSSLMVVHTANSQGSDPVTFIGVNGEVYVIEGTVVRTLPNGQKCETQAFSSVRTSCSPVYPWPVLECADEYINNHDFVVADQGWDVIGEDEYYEGEGCGNDGYRVISGDKESGSILYQQLSGEINEDDIFDLTLCINPRPELFNEIPSGSKLVIRTATFVQEGFGCAGDCNVIGTYDIPDDFEPSDVPSWFYDLNFHEITNLKPYLIIHIENDLPSGENSRTRLGIDNVCIEKRIPEEDLCCKDLEFEYKVSVGFDFEQDCKNGSIYAEPIFLDACDEVEWYIDGTYHSTTQGDQVAILTGFTSFNGYNVQMIVRRYTDSGEVCLEGSFEKGFEYHCPNCEEITMDFEKDQSNEVGECCFNVSFDNQLNQGQLEYLSISSVNGADAHFVPKGTWVVNPSKDEIRPPAGSIPTGTYIDEFLICFENITSSVANLGVSWHISDVSPSAESIVCPFELVMTECEKLTTSTAEVFGNVDFNIFPNPTSNQITILSSQYVSDPVTISLFDISGRKIRHTKIEQLGIETRIEMEDLSDGVYLLELKTQKGIAFRSKVIKIH